jgi:hypothetical protein
VHAEPLAHPVGAADDRAARRLAVPTSSGTESGSELLQLADRLADGVVNPLHVQHTVGVHEVVLVELHLRRAAFGPATITVSAALVPVSTQTPPVMWCCSATQTRLPGSAAAMAAFRPPGPDPITGWSSSRSSVTGPASRAGARWPGAAG